MNVYHGYDAGGRLLVGTIVVNNAAIPEFVFALTQVQHQMRRASRSVRRFAAVMQGPAAVKQLRRREVCEQRIARQLRIRDRRAKRRGR